MVQKNYFWSEIFLTIRQSFRNTGIEYPVGDEVNIIASTILLEADTPEM